MAATVPFMFSVLCEMRRGMRYGVMPFIGRQHTVILSATVGAFVAACIPPLAAGCAPGSEYALVRGFLV